MLSTPLKKAIGYVRISTKDQSNFSLDGQEEYIRNYCRNKGWELVGISRDDGESAKNFDRASWRELERYIKNNYKDIDFLVVTKYDRFSRNVSEALVAIDRLEKKYGIQIMSVMEPIGLHHKSPYFFQFRTQMLIGAEVELMVIKDRTKFGIVQATRSGRYPRAAPFGYSNIRDDRNRPMMVINEAEAPLVKEAFTLFVNGTTMAEIRRILKPKGYSREGNSVMQTLLSNPVYAGMVKVPAYYDEPEELVTALHAPIIDRATWWKAQAILNGKSQNRVVYNEAVPLRGSLLCHCKKPLTAGNSKGRSKYYWYYKCLDHPKTNLKAEVLHSQFDELLEELSFPEQYISHLEKQAASRIEERMQDRKLEVQRKQSELKELEANIEGLEEKYLKNDIAKETYKKWQIRWECDRTVLTQELQSLKTPIENVWKSYKENLHKLQNLRYIYSKADIHQKQAFIRLVFDNKLWYQDGVYRTTYLLPIFGLKAAVLAEKRLLVVEQPCENLRGIPVSAPNGNSIEPFAEFLEWIRIIKAA